VSAVLERHAARSPEAIAARVEAIDWRATATDLDSQGWALFPNLLTPAECREIAGLYAGGGRFRSRVVMARHGFGRGEYQYFAYPLPDLVEGLRSALYQAVNEIGLS
jgi:uncharacterized protein